jgi:hypothetical protein
MGERMNVPMEAPIVATALKGNEAALALIRRFGQIAHTWDDLVDRDRPVSDADINSVFVQALIDLPLNPFYAEHFVRLNEIMLNSITNWRIANELERQEKPQDGDLTIAFIIRSSYIDMVVQCALLIGGLEWAVACGVELRRWAHSEGWAKYLINLKAEKAARKG